MINEIIISTSAIILFVVYYFVHASRLQRLRTQLESERIQKLAFQEQLMKAEQECNGIQDSLLRTREELAASKQESIHLEQRIRDMREDEKRMENQFELLSNRMLKMQGRQMLESNSREIMDILNPLKEKIRHFEDKIEKSNIESARQHESLKEQIRHLGEKSEKVSEDANKLAKALKGDFKKQGHWGEMILESILDKSGLEKNREYYTQSSGRDEAGKLQRPDVIIKLPDNKILIIDSKVSLRAYCELIDADNSEDASAHRKAHHLAVKKHIDTLSQKRYQELYKVESPDFVLMFIPMDTAFTAALEQDPDLYNYAFDKNIVIVTSSSLLATLKTVESMWRNEKQNRYALTIASEAGKMYDKFVGFVEDMNRMGKQLSTVQSTYSDSMRKLYNGTGNLVSKAEKIRELGAKASKKIQVAAIE